MGGRAANKPRSNDAAPDDDPLGPVIEQHGITLAALMFVTSLLAAIGGLVLFYGLSREPQSVLWMSLGGGGLALALAFAILNVSNLGKRLELRKRGIRFVNSGKTTELFWPDIVAVDVKRRDATSVGPVRRVAENSDAVTPSGPLTKTEWDVTIRGGDGRSIRLKPAFFRIVGDPKNLVSNLKLRAGI